MKHVIFDIDGLMFDTLSCIVHALDYAGEKIGIGKAGYMVDITNGMSISMSKHIWKSEFGDLFNEKALKYHTKEYLKNYYKNNKAPEKEGLQDIIKYLNKNDYVIAVASSSPYWEVERHLKDANIFDHFKVIISGDMVEKSKPDPLVYIKVCETLKIEPKDCYAIEDSKNGLLSAISAGCIPIMIPDRWKPDNEIKSKLFKIFNDLNELRDFLKEND